jgi:hypothetical protein
VVAADETTKRREARLADDGIDPELVVVVTSATRQSGVFALDLVAVLGEKKGGSGSVVHRGFLDLRGVGVHMLLATGLAAIGQTLIPGRPKPSFRRR